ncbi:MAG: hypothetical protein NC350_03160 [Corallococcus sp.]|nr:hypothetical protein [Corallococcus sp.]
MDIYNTILTVIYLIFVAVIAVCVAVGTYRNRKVTDKIVGAIALIMLLLRLFLIK